MEERLIDRDPGDADILLGNTQLTELLPCPFAGNGIKIRFRVQPDPMDIKIRDDRDQSGTDLPCPFQRRDDLAGQKMGRDHIIKILVFKESSQALRVEPVIKPAGRAHQRLDPRPIKNPEKKSP